MAACSLILEENHYILVNRRNEIIEFLKQEMNLTCVGGIEKPMFFELYV